MSTRSARPAGCGSFTAIGPGRCVGYRVAAFDPARRELVSGADSRIRLAAQLDAFHTMPGAGMFLGASAEYVLRHYAHHAINALLTYEFMHHDVTRGVLTDVEPEIAVRRARLIGLALYDEDGHPLATPRANPAARVSATRRKLQPILDEAATQHRLPLDVAVALTDAERAHALGTVGTSARLASAFAGGAYAALAYAKGPMLRRFYSRHTMSAAIATWSQALEKTYGVTLAVLVLLLRVHLATPRATARSLGFMLAELAYGTADSQTRDEWHVEQTERPLLDPDRLPELTL